MVSRTQAWMDLENGLQLTCEIGRYWPKVEDCPNNTTCTGANIARELRSNFWVLVLPHATHRTPSPIKQHRPIFVFRLIWTFLRIKMGYAAKAKSDTAEMTGEYCQPRHNTLIPITTSLTYSLGRWWFSPIVPWRSKIPWCWSSTLRWPADIEQSTGWWA